MEVSEDSYPDPHHDTYSKTMLGFWIYLITDFVLFATLFAAYLVLRDNVFGGPSAKDLFDPEYALFEGIILLISAFTIGMAGVSAHRENKNLTMLYLGLTFLLGLFFVGLEFNQFSHLISAGHSWKNSAFLSVYFSLVGTHTIHILFGLVWILVFLLPIFRFGLTPEYIKRVSCLRMFWQFLNVIWVFIFSFVYLLGVI